MATLPQNPAAETNSDFSPVVTYWIAPSGQSPGVMSSAAASSLSSSGWRLDADKLEAMVREAATAKEEPSEAGGGGGGKKKGPKSVTAQEVALNSDLKDVGAAWLSEALGDDALRVPDGGRVAQISKLRNVSAPKANEESGAAPRMIRLTLTDGHSSVQAIEIRHLDKVRLKTYTWPFHPDGINIGSSTVKM